ncbi:hypothetical protein IGI04_022995, partial [Brassica rapa subsp. trilocularis]
MDGVLEMLKMELDACESTQVKHNEVMQMGDKLWYMESLRGVTLYQVENRYMDQLL